ncbi:hypothetical protein BH10PSE14_BH10PSE14_15470 [soil metagenome]
MIEQRLLAAVARVSDGVYRTESQCHEDPET